LSAGFGPSNHFLWASNVFILFDCGLRSLELFSSGQQRLYIIRVWVLIPRIASFGHQCFHSTRIRTAVLRISVLCYQCFRKCPNFGGNIPVRMPYVKYEGKSTVGNTRWPGIRIKRALSRNFPYLRYEVCIDGRIECLTLNWASTW
jgi:hypothetical protein